MKPTMTAKRKISTAVIAVLLSALLVVSGVMIYRELHTQQKEKEDFRELAEMVAPESDTETEPETQRESEASETAEPEEALRDLSGLFAENSECIGGLCIPRNICAATFTANTVKAAFRFWTSAAIRMAGTCSFTVTT